MRLDLYGQTATETTKQIGATDLTKAHVAKQQVKATSYGVEDKTTLSSGAESVSNLAKAALEVTPSRAARVAALKQAVSTAQYQLDTAKIAAALSASDV